MKHFKIGKLLTSVSWASKGNWSWAETSESGTRVIHLFSVTQRLLPGNQYKTVRICIGPLSISFARTLK